MMEALSNGLVTKNSCSHNGDVIDAIEKPLTGFADVYSNVLNIESYKEILIAAVWGEIT